MKTSKKKQSSRESSIRQDIRHLGVLIERVDDNVKLVAEQHGDIKKDIGGIKKTLDSHTEMIGNLAVELEIVKGDVKTTKVELEIIKGDVKTTKIDIEIIKTDIEFIKNSVKKKIDIDEFAALERRVVLLERHR